MTPVPFIKLEGEKKYDLGLLLFAKDELVSEINRAYESGEVDPVSLLTAIRCIWAVTKTKESRGLGKAGSASAEKGLHLVPSSARTIEGRAGGGHAKR